MPETQFHFMEGFIMTQKKANQAIGCDVCTCVHHCSDSNHCSLPEINVCACKNCHSGRPEDESMCGSYQGK